MKKIYEKEKVKKALLIMIFTIIILFLRSNKVEAANTINKIEMNIYINQNGTAEVTEIWYATLDQGTEGYKPYGNLGNSKITNFTVTDETGTKYTTLSSWNTSKSFLDKAYTYGINETSTGIELCWGISKYGDKTYTLKYNITNLVQQYEDYQGIYFSFMPKEMDQSPKSVVITISMDKDFTYSNSQIWAFGYSGGTINFSDGCIVMDSNGKLSSSSYMTALIRIENSTFNTTNNVSKTFNEVYEEALSDIEEEESYLDVVKEFVLEFMSFIILFVFCGIITAVTNSSKAKKTKYDFGEEGKKLPKNKKIEYYREIPCNKDLYKAYWVIQNFDIMKEQNSRSGLIGAIFLDWIKEGYVTIFKAKKRPFSIKDNNYAIDLSKFEKGRNEVEDKLLVMLKKASGKNKILEAKELEKYCRKNYYSFESWFKQVIKYEEKQLKKEKLITETIEEKRNTLGRLKRNSTIHVNPSMKEEAIKLLGLKKFLLDYSLITEREAIEVQLWEEYLIFAQLLGIADKVEKQFSKIYPDFNDLSRLNTEYCTIYARQMAYVGVSAVRSGRIESSSGGGGGSFSGGGGSAGGSSSGGGFR